LFVVPISLKKTTEYIRLEKEPAGV